MGAGRLREIGAHEPVLPDKERGSKVVICMREFKNDAAGAAPYSLLGLCDFVKYEGSRPMNITWKLERAIPAKYLRKTGKLVV